MKKNIAKWIATSLGFGYAPKAPGTFGAVFGVIAYVGLTYAYDMPIGTMDTKMDMTLIILCIICTILGTWSESIIEEEWGHDNGKVVIDESIGVWITMLFMPFTWLNILLAFILFRFYDILKPAGIKSIDEKMHSPFSVMLDDIVAGVYAAITLQLIIYFI